MQRKNSSINLYSFFIFIFVQRALIYSSDDGKQLNDSGDGASTSGAVPKLTLKLGTNNSPQHSSDDRKS